MEEAGALPPDTVPVRTYTPRRMLMHPVSEAHPLTRQNKKFMWQGGPRVGPAPTPAVTGWGLLPCNDTQPTVIDRPRAMHPSGAGGAEPLVGPPL